MGNKGVKRGVSAYSYTEQYGITMNLEDVFEEMLDIGATGIEILGNTHIDNYPHVSDEWFSNWQRMLKEYNVEPAVS